MRYWRFLAIATMILCSRPAWSLDPLAPRSERGEGRVVVHTPQPDNAITITNTKSGASFSPKDRETISVPIGDYNLNVKMQDYSYQQNFHVAPTETSFLVVPGFGSLKVDSLHPTDQVAVTSEKTGQVVANFPAADTKILPRGHYDVKVDIPGMLPAVQKHVWVVTNTTRVVEVKK
ncbi:MAG: hypothetical protein K8R69_05600 [Deltaproteobacteria bacterium]|nr:hypothetical protein [Deltaproteobacteria bacterium]